MATAKKKQRVACFIDGFNLYHAIVNLRDENQQPYPYLKWLNLRSLAGAFITPTTQEITKVFYYSAYATWLPDAYKRHRAYTAVLQSLGVEVVMGRFKEKTHECHKCKASWKVHSEKESDVNLALGLISEAHAKTFDHALILTADSDQCPSIRMVKKLFPALGIEVLTPPLGYDLANELRGIAPTKEDQAEAPTQQPSSASDHTGGWHTGRSSYGLRSAGRALLMEK